MSGIWLASYVGLWILVTAMAVILLGLVRQLGVIQLRLGPETELLTTMEGLEYGTPGPDFRLRQLPDGKILGLHDLRGKPTVLVFFSPSCSACVELAPHLVQFHRSRARKVNVALISQAGRDSTLDLVREFKLSMPILADETGAVSREYQVRATPYAYRLDRDGIVRRRGIVNTLDNLEALLDQPGDGEVLIDLPHAETRSSSTRVRKSKGRR